MMNTIPMIPMATQTPSRLGMSACGHAFVPATAPVSGGTVLGAGYGAARVRFQGQVSVDVRTNEAGFTAKAMGARAWRSPTT
ncbi:hypothetical protein [Nocardioides sp. KR10-350]|uniref:hypothetical protein n=1 Tax=Nocardioides cheoyonin TaxID=3156615 RepID=UPI0032B34414